MGAPTVTPERTAWRDVQFSLRHRDWGWDCPAVDIDFLMVEYDQAEPRAIIEYKHESAQEPTSEHPSYRSVCKLADRGRIPFFVVRYADDLSWWWVIGLNGRARHLLGETPNLILFAEAEYVRFLYETVRDRTFPTDLMEKLMANPFIRDGQAHP